MDEIERLRQLQIDILLEIKRICDENDIQWFMTDGTFLGAVRHKGFIPWDDDIDIGMLQSEYERFISTAPKQLSDKFYLDCYQTNKNCSHVFSKVRLKGTVYCESKASASEKHNEIFVDIFPYYYVSDNKKVRHREANLHNIFKQLVVIKNKVQPWKGESISKMIKFIPLRIAANFINKAFLWKKIIAYQTKYKSSGFVSPQFMGYMGKIVYPAEIFCDIKKIRFEKYMFNAIKDADTYLTITYGDYMKLPPENERKTHQILKLDFGPYSISK